MSEPEQLVNPMNLAFAEDLYERFLVNPSAVAPEWQSYFSRLGNGELRELRFPAPRFGPSFRPASLFNPPSDTVSSAAPLADRDTASLHDRVYLLIRLYRVRGHRIARVDPLGRIPPTPPELQPEFFGFSDADMNRPVYSETFQYDGPMTLGELLQRLQNTYCRSIGVQYMHIDDLGVRRWLQRRMETTENRLQLTRDEQLRILTRLTDAVTFEEFIRKKFVGAKTFSLDGSESLIPLLDLAIEKAGEQGIREIVLGMAHRGRLNVLANIMRKSPRQIFREFADSGWKSSPGRGDVKYHLGHSTHWTTVSGEKIRLALCFNPSHLEFVNPVVLGRVRARQDCDDDQDRTRGLAIMIHGDASFAGQGVIQETLNLSDLPGYTVGGALHVVVNNQIGFTTGPEQARSSVYATDVAKMLQIPIFHVNGEDPEAVAQVVRLGMDFRREFQRDVVINMYGYRRLGHNESDEPTFTQPDMYRRIAERPSVREGYLEHLLKLEGVTREEADAIAANRREMLEKELAQSQSEQTSVVQIDSSTRHKGGPEPVDDDLETGIPRETLSSLLHTLTHLPDGFHPHPKIKRFLQSRQQMARGEQPLDWSAAEALAFASLAAEGVRIRFTGQDSERGTFSQRHAVLHDHQNGAIHSPFRFLHRTVESREPGAESPPVRSSPRPSTIDPPPSVGPVEILNSPLSETAVLGFEYGYSLDCPGALVLWEAQFGDFWNVAQPIVDQFIASAEDKWQQLSGLVLLLPHGYEGAGPEHSSARLERFLWLAAEDNIQVVYPTTPAQYFHVLRRQALRNWRKPLVIMTPKSLLRHPKVTSSLEECAHGRFQRVLTDPDVASDRATRILFCSGKIYFELLEHRAELKRKDVAILRLEQLYPLRRERLEQALAPFRSDIPVFWVQEEPANMGAGNYLRMLFGEQLFHHPLRGIARAISATPSTGSSKRHKQEQSDLILRAFGEKSS